MQFGLNIFIGKNLPKIAGLAAAALSFYLLPPAPAAFAAAVPALRGAQAAFQVPAGEYAADKNHTNVLWMVTHFGMSHYYGRFDDINAALILDGKDIAQSKLRVEIDPKSVSTNHTSKPNMFNEKIAGPKILDSAQFPLIRFESTHITLTGAKTGIVTGNLTLHGVTKPIKLDAVFNKSMNPQPKLQAPALGFSATAAFKRSDFGLTQLMPRVSDEVKLVIEAEFYQKNAHDAAMAKAAAKNKAEAK